MGRSSGVRPLRLKRLAQDGLQVTIEIAGQRRLPGPVEVNLYRITQEALNNITRHAGVRQALIRLCLESPSASLDIEDRGCGFDRSGARHLDGFGLTGMTGRASEIGWKLEIKSVPGQGTQIHVEENAL